MLRREKGIRKRVKALIGQNSNLEGSDLEIAESFIKGLANALEIDGDKINKKDIKEWLISFVKCFVLPINQAQLISPTHKELHDYGHLLGQYLSEPIVLSLQEQQIIQPRIQPKENGIFKGGIRTRLKEKLQQQQHVEQEPEQGITTQINETERLLKKHIEPEDYVPNAENYIEQEKKVNYKDYIEKDEEENNSFNMEI